MRGSLLIVLLLFGAGGCIFKDYRHTDIVAGYGAALHGDAQKTARAGSAHVMVGVGGVHVGLEAEVVTADRPDIPREHTGGGLAIYGRFSPIGMFAREHWLERYFDGGVEFGGLGAAVAATTRKVEPYGHSWAGAWVELGLVPVGDGYLAATGSLRWVDAESPWVDRDQLVVGVAWRARGPVRTPWRD